MMKTVLIQNWSVIGGGSPYTAPELCTRHLRGEVYDHPAFTDGERIRSSALQSIDDGTATTHYTTYTLGNPSPDYTAWCIRNGHNVWKCVSFQFQPSAG